MKIICAVTGAVALAICLNQSFAVGQEPLASWKPGPVKDSLEQFVQQVCDPGSEHYVAPGERIAVFDNDGTLWSEKPFYFQLAFAIDRVKVLAEANPQWSEEQPFKAALEGDIQALTEGGMDSLLKLVFASHAGNTTSEFNAIVKDWIATARHPRNNRLYREMVFQPMLELLDYLRQNEFKVWIVSGGGIEFMRAWVGEVYGIPPEQVIGSSAKVEFDIRNGKPVLARLAELDFISDKQGKPVAINKHIGRRPILAFGNSDGDMQMLQWTTAGDGPRLGLIVHHTDEVREWAYDRTTHVGRLDKALDMAGENGWQVVDMKRDWAVVYPYNSRDLAQQADAESEHHYFSKSGHDHAVEWGYTGDTGPEFWGGLDSSFHLARDGRRQSPIDIVTRSAAHRDLPRLVFDYRPERITSHNNGHTIQHDEAPGSFMYVGNRQYALEQFHVHTPSEHTIDGKQFEMELHFVHRSKTGQVAVLAVLVQAVENGGVKVPLYTLPGREGEVVAYKGRRNPANFLPRSRDYFAYDGSFTTPPCTENIKWIVMQEPVTAHQDLIDRFSAILKSNNRPVQPLNNRSIFKSD